jgi:hypothetical protein
MGRIAFYKDNEIVDVSAANPMPVATLVEPSRQVILTSATGSITVPAGTEIQPLHVLVIWTSDATVGNRRLILEALDGGNVIAEAIAQVEQAASLVWRYSFALGVASDFAATVLRVNVTMPAWVLSAGQTLRVRDVNAIAAGDSVAMTAVAVSKAV